MDLNESNIIEKQEEKFDPMTGEKIIITKKYIKKFDPMTGESIEEEIKDEENTKLNIIKKATYNLNLNKNKKML